MHRGDYIHLSPLKDNDYQLLFDWINDRDLVVLNSRYRPIMPLQQRSWMESLAERNDIVIFGIRLNHDDSLIGTCRLGNIDHLNQSAELAIRIGNSESRGKGFGTEACKLLVRFGFSDLNLNRIQLYVFTDNIRAYKTYLNVGFIDEGVLRQYAFIDGNFKDVRILSILRDDYVK